MDETSLNSKSSDNFNGIHNQNATQYNQNSHTLENVNINHSAEMKKISVANHQNSHNNANIKKQNSPGKEKNSRNSAEIIENHAIDVKRSLESIHEQMMEQMNWLHGDQNQFEKEANNFLDDLASSKDYFENRRLQKRKEIEEKYKETSIEQLLERPEFQRLKRVPLENSQLKATYGSATTNHNEDKQTESILQNHQEIHQNHDMPSNSLIKSQYEEFQIDDDFIMKSNATLAKSGVQNYNISDVRASKFSAMQYGKESEAQDIKSSAYTTNQMNDVNHLLSLNKNDESLHEMAEDAESFAFEDEKNMEHPEEPDNSEGRVDQLLKDYGIEDSDTQSQNEENDKHDALPL